MSNVYVNFSEQIGKIKPMHAVNNGPIVARGDQTSGNAPAYRAARIPYARNHDAAFCASYGGEHTVDITAIFPCFDADENDPRSYDFHYTDEYIEKTLSVGTETFFRLGQKIEHGTKKYGIIPPRDFHKWARICEHIIRHMNEGWADGHHYGITYWEIWNEPDLDPDDSPKRRCWTGTEREFFDLYEITAKHLKSCFPHLKIGGPALASHLDWADRFLSQMKERGVPMDFFSWHIYASDTQRILNRARAVRELLVKHGYGHAQSILNEYNYVKGWSSEFVYSLKTIANHKGAAFFADAMLRCQGEEVDMLMYYDARPTGFNGFFAPYTYELQKPYYALCMFSDLYALGTEVAAKSDDGGISVVAATNGDERGVMFCYYTDDDSCTEEKTVCVHTGTHGKAKVRILDKTKNARVRVLPYDSVITLTLKPNTVAYIAIK